MYIIIKDFKSDKGRAAMHWSSIENFELLDTNYGRLLNITTNSGRTLTVTQPVDQHNHCLTFENMLKAIKGEYQEDFIIKESI